MPVSVSKTVNRSEGYGDDKEGGLLFIFCFLIMVRETKFS
jgi:hypothetical protein